MSEEIQKKKRRMPAADRAIGREIAVALRGMIVPMREWQSRSRQLRLLAERGKDRDQVYEHAQSLLEQVRQARDNVHQLADELSPHATQDSRYRDKLRSLTQLARHLATSISICRMDRAPARQANDLELI